jgi:hypothetical protein
VDAAGQFAKLGQRGGQLCAGRVDRRVRFLVTAGAQPDLRQA